MAVPKAIRPQKTAICARARVPLRFVISLRRFDAGLRPRTETRGYRACSNCLPVDGERVDCSEKTSFGSSLRRHYPDQVQRVDGDEAILSAGSYPSSPSRITRANLVI